MAAAHRMRREEEFLKKRDYFRRNAFWIIEEMVELSPQHPSVLVDEVLHGIFFLGDIFTPPYSPKDIVSDDDMLNTLKGRYPRPFQLYSSQVPKRSPISCVLDMIVLLIGREKEDQIVKKLRQLIVKLKQNEATDLISSTICVSQPNNTRNSPRYYGVSMSTSGRNPGRIMIAASCLSNWEHYVAGAVMTYYPNNKKKGYFDGTIKLPKQVRCQAFSLSREEEMPPCRSCGNLFGLTTSDTKEWPYGNCAEPECVSNLLRNEKEVREQARPKSPTCTDANREKAKESVLKELTNILRMVQFSWDKTFYAPQV
ncbi:uncharacterized protein LOC127378981 [Dicentrarchus labrax]|uniref:uncharacterized protein LOC127378981 n=1 Tax=Dicentrarchus labrax TaxID=13489 RepID=UPI0021F65DD2|nr:uncharacterized protein LOC127378981 [Dicentrarchus labrax]